MLIQGFSKNDARSIDSTRRINQIYFFTEFYKRIKGSISHHSIRLIRNSFLIFLIHAKLFITKLFCNAFCIKSCPWYAGSDLGYLICLRHLFKSKSVIHWFFFSENTRISSHVRNLLWDTFLILVPCSCHVIFLHLVFSFCLLCKEYTVTQKQPE